MKNEKVSKNNENSEAWSRNFSRNLNAIKRARGESLAEFASELSVPKSTLQSILKDGNTTLHTAVHISKSLDRRLDDLIDGDLGSGFDSEDIRLAKSLEGLIEVFCLLDENEQRAFEYHITEILKLASKTRPK